MNLFLTLLLCFSYYEESFIEPDDDQEPVRRKSKSKKKSSFNQSTSERKLSDNNFVVPSEHLKKRCTVKYTIPGKLEGKKLINVLYLGDCAEISVQNASIMVKCYVVGNKSFVPFTIIHKIRTDESQAPLEIRSHDIQLDFTFTDEKINDKITDKPFYYLKENNADGYGYLVEPEPVCGTIPTKIEEKSVKCSDDDILLSRPCKFHWATLDKMVKETIRHLDFLERKRNEKLKCSEFDSSDATNNAIGGEKSKNKLRESQVPNVTINVSGDHLIYEKPLWRFQKFNDVTGTGLPCAGLVLMTRSLYDKSHRSFYKPFSIFIKSIRNLPPSVKENYKIDKISLEYSFPPIFDREVIEPHEIDDILEIKFNCPKTFFNDSVPDENLIEALQNGYLVVRIVGHRNIIDSINGPRVWGQELNCTDFTKRFSEFIGIDKSMDLNDRVERETEKNDGENNMAKKKNGKNNKAKKNNGENNKTKKNNGKNKNKSIVSIEIEPPKIESVTLGYAFVSLNNSIKYSCMTVKFAEIRSSYLPVSENLHLGPMNVLYFHSDRRRIQKGLIPSQDFIYHNTTLKIEFKSGYDLMKNVLSNVLLPTLYKVCIIIDNDTSRVYSLLKQILEHNKSCLPYSPLIPTNKFQNLFIRPDIQSEFMRDKDNMMVENGSKSYVIENEFDDCVTGFMVDAIDFSILFCECLEIHALPKILVHRYQMPRDEGKLLYDSNLVFTTRFYREFVKFGGIFVSALGLPLRAILTHARLKDYIPPTALRCIESLVAITDSTRVRRNLFPSNSELLSMDMEFGVPLHRADLYAT